MTSKLPYEPYFLCVPFVTLRYGWLDDDPSKLVYAGKIHCIAENTLAVHYTDKVNWSDPNSICEVSFYKTLVGLLSEKTRFESLYDLQYFLSSDGLDVLARNLYATKPERMPDGKSRGEIHDMQQTSRRSPMASFLMDYEVCE